MIDNNGSHDNSKIFVLLCIGDVTPADGELALPLAPLFGQPMVHHMVKALQRVGITQFFLGVDSVPGALLTYRDAVAKEGLDLRFIREPSAMAALMDGGTRALILRADTIWDTELVDRALRHNGPIVATVEERAENQMFERIDLNNRWAGMAILDRKTLEALTHLPEGWDMASALLRQALQDGVKPWPVKQNAIQDGHLCRLQNHNDLIAMQSVLMTSAEGGQTTLETTLFAKPLARFVPAIWAVPWGRSVAEFSFPGLSGVAALFAVTGFPLTSAIAATGAVLASLVRNVVRSAEYRSAGIDGVGMAGWAMLIAALIAVLELSDPSLFESVFLGLTLTGLSLISVSRGKKAGFRFLSPLVITLTLILGIGAGSAAISVKLLILIEIVFQLLRGLGYLQNPKPLD